jgi:AraC family L-rhamnose operon regulatory protein RhaS
MRPRQAATFRSVAELFHADTCEPLEAAARRGEVRLAALGRGSYPGRRLPAGDLREVRSVGFWGRAGNPILGT